MFPAKRRWGIGNRNGTNFFILNDSPAPSYLPPQGFDCPVHKISGAGDPYRPNDNPGPGEYDPNYLPSSRTTALAVPGRDRAGWLGIIGNPAPGAYTPSRASLPREPAYSIGRRSRRHRRQKPRPPQIRFVVDVFLVTIRDPELDEEDASNYMNSHRELRAILVEVIQAIFASKPIAPLAYLRGYFRLIRDGHLPDRPQYDPDDPPHRYHLW
jgi:hypothetical protein